MRDPEAVRAARRRWYRNNREHAKAKVVERKRLLIQRLQAHRADLGCQSCGESHPGVLDFHHTVPLSDGDPNSRVYNLIWRRGWGWARVSAYLERECEVLCANCHQKRHWEDSE